MTDDIPQQKRASLSSLFKNVLSFIFRSPITEIVCHTQSSNSNVGSYIWYLFFLYIVCIYKILELIFQLNRLIMVRYLILVRYLTMVSYLTVVP